MEFGLLKSKIEAKLVESYKNKTFNAELKKFKKYILENKGLNQTYYLYDELSKQKSFDKNFAEDYLNECIELYQNIKLNKKSLAIVENWVKNVVVENQYSDIDTAFTKKTFVIENILMSKNNIINNLSSQRIETDVINIEMSKMVEVANNTIKNYLSQIDESEVKEIKKYISLSEEEIKKRYDVLSEMAIEKLEVMAENSEPEIKNKISETIDRIKSDKIDAVSLIKIKNLNEDL